MAYDILILMKGMINKFVTGQCKNWLMFKYIITTSNFIHIAEKNYYC